jgi:hypothetical protein
MGELRRLGPVGRVADPTPTNAYQRTFAAARNERVAFESGAWQKRQESHPRPSAATADNHVSACQPRCAVSDHQHPLSVPRFPWYY